MVGMTRIEPTEESVVSHHDSVEPRNNAMLNDGIRVLVVEDNPDWSHVLTSMIHKADSFHLIGSASNGIEAVEQAASAKPDLILLDIGLPKLNGLEAARQIRAVSS